MSRQRRILRREATSLLVTCLGSAPAIATILLLFQAAALPAIAQERETARGGTESGDNARRMQMQRFARIAADYKLFAGSQGEQKLDPLKEPILRWSNPLRETGDSTVFLWTHAARPAAALCIYTYGDNNVGHEFQSLATGPLVATYRESRVWNPERAGIEFQSVPGDPKEPATKPTLRLSQMRELMRDFSASVGRDERRHELRLMPQPLYRYGDKKGDVLDGAVFAFAQGTDPELLLLVEVYKRPGQPHIWQYAAARMNMGNLELKYRDGVVWTIDNWNRVVDPREPYITFTHKLEP